MRKSTTLFLSLVLLAFQLAGVLHTHNPGNGVLEFSDSAHHSASHILHSNGSCEWSTATFFSSLTETSGQTGDLFSSATEFSLLQEQHFLSNHENARFSRGPPAKPTLF